MDFVEKIPDTFLGDILVAVDFFNDNFSFFFHFVRIKTRMHQHIGNYVERKRNVFSDDLGVKACFLPGRIGFEISTAIFNRMGNFKRRTLFRPFENKMLVKMGKTVRCRIFMARAARNPHADIRGISSGHIIRDDRDSIFQFGFRNFLSKHTANLEKLKGGIFHKHQQNKPNGKTGKQNAVCCHDHLPF